MGNILCKWWKTKQRHSACDDLIDTVLRVTGAENNEETEEQRAFKWGRRSDKRRPNPSTHFITSSDLPLSRLHLFQWFCHHLLVESEDDESGTDGMEMRLFHTHAVLTHTLLS